MYMTYAFVFGSVVAGPGTSAARGNYDVLIPFTENYSVTIQAGLSHYL